MIKQKKYAEAGTDILSIDTNNHKIIYLVDHSSDSELADNLREGGDGFGIRRTFNKDKLTEDDVRAILGNIASDFDHSEARISKVLQDIGIGSEILSSIDIAAELKMGIDSNARMDASGGRQAISPEYNEIVLMAERVHLAWMKKERVKEEASV